jgi:hypothetical protein
MSIDAWTRDVSHAFRRMARAPGFTLVAAVMLALGIGGTSAARGDPMAALRIE